MLTEEQKKERLLGIGGSDASAIVGLSKWKSPLDVYLEKTGQKEDGGAGEAAYWGNMLEEEVAKEYARKRGVELLRPEKAIVHPKYYWMRCNLDFVVKNSTIMLECKTSGFSGDEWGEEGTDEIPSEYLIQCAHNAVVSDAVYGTTQVDVPVLFGGYGGHRHRIYTYIRNKNLESKIIDMEGAFWQEHVEKMIPPTPTTFSETLKLWPEAQDEIEKVASEYAIDTIESLRNIKNQIKILQDQEDSKKADLCNYMEDSSILIDSDGSRLATWKNQETNRVNVTRLKEERPELCNEYLKKSKTRVLRIA